MTRYLACQFSKSTFSTLVKESFDIDFSDVFRKSQIEYIFKYLKDLAASSVVLEFDYLDKDYLEDYSRYYVKCFSNHGHKTTRLHFFSNEVSHKEIDAALNNNEHMIQKIQDGYLGFMVIKPVQKTFIGKTCLKLYSSFYDDVEYRNCLKREYKVSLFGIPLCVKSVAFQEQDKVVSACATTAIWASLHAMKCRLIRDIPSCSEITSDALNHISQSENLFPNKELSNKQILRALDCQHLRHHVFNIQKYDGQKFINNIKIHIDSGIPLILGADVYKKNTSGSYERLDGHAVTILGYKNDDNEDRAIYVHDDRFGPFARAVVKPLTDEFKSIIENLKNDPKFGLVLQKRGEDNGCWSEPHEILIPSALICSTHKKVRLSSDFSVSTAEMIEEYFKNDAAPDFLKSIEGYVDVENEDDELSGPEINIEDIIDTLSHDVSLKEISDIKNEIIKNTYDSLEVSSFEKEKFELQKRDFLTKSYARNHWVAQFKYKSGLLFKVLFDATEIPQGNAVVGVYPDSVEGSVVLSIFLEHIKLAEQEGLNVENREQVFFNSFVRALKHSDSSERAFYLDSKFGELRAPHYIKDKIEISFNDIKDNPSKKIIHQAQTQSLKDLFKTELSDSNQLIWAVGHDGSLIIGKEYEGTGGHPCITRFKPARIAGELKFSDNKWLINAKSGRYSSNYSNSDCFLKNAIELFKDLFYRGGEVFTIDPDFTLSGND